jgi:hypothetical protein
MEYLKQIKADLSYKSEVWAATENNKVYKIADIHFLIYALRLIKQKVLKYCTEINAVNILEKRKLYLKESLEFSVQGILAGRPTKRPINER